MFRKAIRYSSITRLFDEIGQVAAYIARGSILTTGVTDLDAGLTNVDGDDFTHFSRETKLK